MLQLNIWFLKMEQNGYCNFMKAASRTLALRLRRISLANQEEGVILKGQRSTFNHSQQLKLVFFGQVCFHKSLCILVTFWDILSYTCTCSFWVILAGHYYSYTSILTDNGCICKLIWNIQKYQLKNNTKVTSIWSHVIFRRSCSL